jgi:transposase
VPNRTVNRLSRGDRRRNTKLRQLRSLVRPDLAICAVDLADANQAAVVTDHDSVVLGRRMFRCSAWGSTRSWTGPSRSPARPGSPGWWWLVSRPGTAGSQSLSGPAPVAEHGVCAAAAGASRPRGRGLHPGSLRLQRRHHHRPPDQPAALLPPRVTTPTWARLRHLGQRRAAVLAAATAARQTLRDLLGIGWPSVLEAAAPPLDSLTLRACLAVATDPAPIAAMDYDAFAQAVAAQLPCWGGARRRHQIMRAFFAAAQAPVGSPPSAPPRPSGPASRWPTGIAPSSS